MSQSPVRATRSERRRWRAIVRRLEQAFESDHLSVLRRLAAATAPVYWLSPAGPVAGPLAGPVQLTAGDRRLALGRVQALAWARLSAAVGAGPVSLAGVGRYGRAWVLTFRGPQAGLTLLTDQIRFLPPDGGEAGQSGAPLQLLAS
jgi:hypothetical protein